MHKEITKKQNWAQNHLNELMAEDQEVAKAIKFHGEVKNFAVKAMQALKGAQTSKAAAILDWKGCELDLTSSGIDNLWNFDADREYSCSDAASNRERRKRTVGD